MFLLAFVGLANVLVSAQTNPAPADTIITKKGQQFRFKDLYFDGELEKMEIRMLIPLGIPQPALPDELVAPIEKALDDIGLQNSQKLSKFEKVMLFLALLGKGVFSLEQLRPIMSALEALDEETQKVLRSC